MKEVFKLESVKSRPKLLIIRDKLKKASSKAKVIKFSKTATSIMVSLNKTCSMALANTNGKAAHISTAISVKESAKAKEYGYQTSTLINLTSTKAHINKTKRTVSEYINGQIALYMKGTLRMI